MYFNPNNGFEALGVMIRVVHPGSESWFLPIPDLKKGTGSRIRMRNNGFQNNKFMGFFLSLPALDHFQDVPVYLNRIKLNDVFCFADGVRVGGGGWGGVRGGLWDHHQEGAALAAAGQDLLQVRLVNKTLSKVIPYSKWDRKNRLLGEFLKNIF